MAVVIAGAGVAAFVILAAVDVMFSNQNRGSVDLIIRLCCFAGLLTVIAFAITLSMEPSATVCVARVVLGTVGALASCSSFAVHTLECLRSTKRANTVERIPAMSLVHAVLLLGTVLVFAGGLLALWFTVGPMPSHEENPVASGCHAGSGAHSVGSNARCSWGSPLFTTILLLTTTMLLVYTARCSALCIAASGDKLQGLSALRWLLVPVEAALCGCLLIPAVHLLEAQEAIGVDTSSTLQAVVGLFVSAVFAMSILPKHKSKRIPAHYKGRLHFVESREPLLSLPVPLVEDDAMFSASSSEPEPFKWMLFLSHRWDTVGQHGGQDSVALIKARLEMLLGGDARCFLDVDGALNQISEPALRRHVRSAFGVVLFLTDGYFYSRNCMVELEAAHAAHKPVILVIESDAHHGAQHLIAHRDACPSVHRKYVFGTQGQPRRVIEWRRERPYQLLALRQLVEELLKYHPNYCEIPEEERQLFHPDEAVQKPTFVHHNLVLYHTEQNGVDADLTRELERRLLVREEEHGNFDDGGASARSPIRKVVSRALKGVSEGLQRYISERSQKGQRRSVHTHRQSALVTARSGGQRPSILGAVATGGGALVAAAGRRLSHASPFPMTSREDVEDRRISQAAADEDAIMVEVVSGDYRRIFPQTLDNDAMRRNPNKALDLIGAFPGKVGAILGSGSSGRLDRHGRKARVHGLNAEGRAVRMLLVLRDGCWANPDEDPEGGPLYQTCRAAILADVPIIVAHETVPAYGGRSNFGDYLAVTPKALKVAGLLKPISIALLDGESRATSIALLGRKICESVLDDAGMITYNKRALVKRSTKGGLMAQRIQSRTASGRPQRRAATRKSPPPSLNVAAPHLLPVPFSNSHKALPDEGPTGAEFKSRPAKLGEMARSRSATFASPVSTECKASTPQRVTCQAIMAEPGLSPLEA